MTIIMTSACARSKEKMSNSPIPDVVMFIRLATWMKTLCLSTDHIMFIRLAI